MNIFYFIILIIILIIFEENHIERYYNLFDKISQLEDLLEEKIQDK